MRGRGGGNAVRMDIKSGEGEAVSTRPEKMRILI